MTKQKLLLTLSFAICLACWLYRLSNLNQIIQTGFLPDFQKYYYAAQSLISIKPDPNQILTATFGPPITIIPFIPFSLLPFQFSEYLLTLLNILSFLLVFALLYKKYFSSLDSRFYLLTSILSVSFPLSYSLGSGNPIGFVTLGIYSFWIFQNKFLNWFLFLTSGLLKLFPLVLLPIITKKTSFKLILLTSSFTLLTSVLLIPLSVWQNYLTLPQSFLFSNPDPTIYNQSFSSTLARLNINAPFFSPLSLLALLSLSLPIIIKLKQNRLKNSLDSSIFLLSFALLIHPFPWQYYFAIFLPFVLIKIRQKNYFYLLIFLLLSLDGNKISLFQNSQFLGTLLLYLRLMHT